MLILYKNVGYHDVQKIGNIYRRGYLQIWHPLAPMLKEGQLTPQETQTAKPDCTRRGGLRVA